MRAILFFVAVVAAVAAASTTLFSLHTDDTIFSAPDVERLTGVTVANTVLIAAKRSGRIERLDVKEGDRAEEGAVIAVLDRAEATAQRNASAAKLALTEARLRELEELAILEHERASAELRRAAASLEVARSRAAQAKAELEQDRADEVRARELRQKNLAATQEAERFATKVSVGISRLAAERDRVKVAEAEVVLARAARRREQIAAQQVEQARAEVAMVRAQLSEAEARLADTLIRAPLSGVVSVRIAQQGEVVEAGAPIVSIVDLDDIWVKTEVEESQIRRVRLGTQLAVLLPDGFRTIGTVNLIAPEAKFATQRDVDRVKRDVRTFGFRVALDNAERRIHSGMTAYVLLPQVARLP